ncbi:MAG: nucleotidyltransferase family protein [Clostridia bacterium]|nr:nucleotidyltransferase family protein [Clostridia bacterium]
MNVVGIIAEYNPMHNGHVYNIKKAKELSQADYVIVIMSGSFTEQGNVAVINKLDRSKIAIENGADMVIELPTVYAVSSAENFAFGAVNVLNSLGIITHIAFGAEADNIY